MAEATEETPLRPPVDSTESSITSNESLLFNRASLFTRNAKSATVFIYLTVIFERLGYYAVGNNLTAFTIKGLNFSTNDAVVTTMTFGGTSFFLPLFGGCLADAFIGRHQTVYGGLFLEMIGMLVFLILAFLMGSIQRASKLGLMILALCCIALGQGFIKANIAIFGGDQIGFWKEDSEEKFFRWYYWSINLGAFIAYFPFSLFTGTYTNPIVELVTIALALALYIFGKRTYNIVKPQGMTLFQLLKAMCGNKVRFQTGDGMTLTTLRFQRGMTVTEKELVRHLVELIKIFGTLMVFMTVYSQTGTTYIIQAHNLNTNVSGSIQIEDSFMPIFDPIMGLVFVPLIHFVLMPILHKYGKKPNHLTSIGIGMLFASASALSAAILEVVRHYYTDVRRETLSVFWQVPQYAFMGVGEIFTIISGHQFAFLEAPSNMKGFVMGLFICSWGIGNYLGTLLTVIVNAASDNKWYPNEFDDGHAEYFLFLLSGLSLMAFLAFKIFSHGYVTIGEREAHVRNALLKHQHRQRDLAQQEPIMSVQDDFVTSWSSSEGEEDPELTAAYKRFLDKRKNKMSPPADRNIIPDIFTDTGNSF